MDATVLLTDPGCSERIYLQMRICCPAPRKTKKDNIKLSFYSFFFFLNCKSHQKTGRMDLWMDPGQADGNYNTGIPWSDVLLAAHPSEVALTPDLAALLTAFHI